MLPMIRTRWGRVINISSVAALIGNRGQVNYAAAKGALNAATKALSLEVASRGITVNAVAPGIIAAGMGERHSMRPRIGELVPMKRAGTAEEVANLVAFLASRGGRLHHRPGNFRQRRDDVNICLRRKHPASRSRCATRQPRLALTPGALLLIEEASIVGLRLRRTFLKRTLRNIDADLRKALRAQHFTQFGRTGFQRVARQARYGSKARPARGRPARRFAPRWDRAAADSPAIWRWLNCCPTITETRSATPCPKSGCIDAGGNFEGRHRCRIAGCVGSK